MDRNGRNIDSPVTTSPSRRAARGTHQPTGCNQLQAFVNEVNAYVSAGILTPAQAGTLLGGPLGIQATMEAVPC
jgi:hypothetical protein